VSEMIGNYKHPRMLVERVHCCVCHGSGLVPRMVFGKRACDVCEGRGERKILIAENLSAADRAMVMKSAITGQFCARPNVFPDWLELNL
jgi:DnaJ-class molecular chaperone